MHLTLSVSVSIRVSQISITPDAKQCTLYLAWRYLLRTLFLRPLLETGPPRYVAIRATQRSSHLQGRGSTFDSFLKYFRPWVMIRPPKLNLRPPALQYSQVLYRLSLSCCGHSALYSIHTLSYKIILWTNLVQASLRGTLQLLWVTQPHHTVTNITGKQYL